MKREVMEGDMAEEAKKKIARSINKALKEKAARKDSADSESPEEIADASDLLTDEPEAHPSE